MYRKICMALIALIGFIGILSISTSEAEARRGGHGHGFHRGGHHGHIHRGWGGHRNFGHRHFGHRHFGFRPYRNFGFRPYYRSYPYGFYGGGSCYRWRQVVTPYGIQMRRVWVCGARYY